MDHVAIRRAIECKRDGEGLAPGAWDALIHAYMSGDMDDAQMAALMMACVWRGMDAEEAAALTRAMVASGETLHYPDGMFVVDKHSSGGVSDIVSLVVVPMVAACGVRVAKLSGRALGHTGGTIDKLEAIDGFHAALSMEAFVRQIERVGCAIAAQSDSFVPADKRLYALRDHTATVPSIGLIAASIVSKKIAGGAGGFVFDVKCGTAAFMKDVAQASALARLLVEISAQFGRKARAVVSDMNEPLGRCIGSGIEVIEARDLLRGRDGDERERSLCMHIAAAMLELGGIADPHERALQVLENGAAYEKFVEMVEAQGSSRAALETLAPSGPLAHVRARADGVVASIDAVSLGYAARRMSDRAACAGIRLHVRTGDRIARGDVLADIFGNADPAAIAPAFTLTENAPPARPLIYTTI
jgi:pyrimidine-nucleoside phosphorylase